MKTKKITTCRLLLVLILYCFTNIQAFAQHAVMEVVEVEFTSQIAYVNAYMEVDVWVNLSGPGGTYTIPVFWDGKDINGNDVFRARLVATSPGTWNWNIINSTVTNSDPAFIGKNNSFTASAADTSTNPNNHGFIKVASNNRTLEYADGTPFFYTADTSWAILTRVFGFDQANTISDISFKDYISNRKSQGFNGVNVIASFPDDTYLENLNRHRQFPNQEKGLWSSLTWGEKVAPDGSTPFEMKAGESYTHWSDEVNYKKINPAYWQSVDERMQHLADEGFVTLFESIRRHERWPYRAGQDEKDAFYNYIRYLWARYGCYNMIFSWEHHDYNFVYNGTDNVYLKWLPLVEHAHDSLSARLGNRMPYGQPRTAMSFKTSLENWNEDIPDALDIQNVSNAGRDETMHQWLNDLYDNVEQPALNLEPYYPDWGGCSCNEVKDGLNPTTMAQMNMYGSVLSGGLAGHAWGDQWFAGVSGSNPQENALTSYESQSMGNLKSFILDSDHEYHRLIPAADTHLSDSQSFLHTLSVAVEDDVVNSVNDDVEFALGFITANSSSTPTLTDLIPSKNYLFEWYNVTTGTWISEGYKQTSNSGVLALPTASRDLTKNWAYRLRSEDYVGGNSTNCETNNSFAIRINCGSTSSATYQGNTFSPDNQNGYSFSSGTQTTEGSSAFTLAQPFKSVRYTKQQEIEYLFPISNGDYQVILHFAEPYHGVHPGTNPDTRKFNVDVEGTRIETDLNIISEVGANNVYTINQNVSVADGELNLNFSKGSGNDPIINAIEILGSNAPNVNAGLDQTLTLPENSVELTGEGCDPDGGLVTYLWSQNSGPSGSTLTGTNTDTLSVSGLVEGIYNFQLTVTDDEGISTSDTVIVTVNPEPNTGSFALRINCGSTSSATYQGNTFGPDNQSGYSFSSGTQTTEGSSAFTLAQPFKSVRYTKQQEIEYLFPISNGDYQVILHFAEPYHGVHPGTNPDTRKFNVDVEGTRIETDLNIISEVGANNVYTINQNVSVADGELNLNFSKGSGNDPIINAIEILGDNSTTIDGLIGHWRLDEQNGISANDDSGQGFIGTLENGLNFDTNKTSGQTGGALIFDGLDDKINLPDIDDNLQSGFSVSAWVKPNNAGGSYQGIVGSTTASGFMMFVNQGKLGFKVTTNENGHKLVSQGNIQNNVWQMITCIFDGNEMKWYINGINVHNEPLSGTLKDKNVAWIGWSGWSNEYFEGAIDDVRLFDRPLTQSEVASLFQESNTSPINLTAKLGQFPATNENIRTGYVHPNPTKDRFRITGIPLGEKEIIVADFSGRILITLETDQVEPELNLSIYPDGIYIVKVIQNGLEETFKVVKE